MSIEGAISNELRKLTGLSVTPIYGTGSPPFLTYTHTPQSGGVVRVSQMEVKIIDEDFDHALELKDQINNLLDMPEKSGKTFSNIHLFSELSGGGDIFNDSIQCWECSLIYIMKWRNV